MLAEHQFPIHKFLPSNSNLFVIFPLLSSLPHYTIALYVHQRYWLYHKLAQLVIMWYTLLWPLRALYTDWRLRVEVQVVLAEWLVTAVVTAVAADSCSPLWLVLSNACGLTKVSTGSETLFPKEKNVTSLMLFYTGNICILFLFLHENYHIEKYKWDQTRKFRRVY